MDNSEEKLKKNEASLDDQNSESTTQTSETVESDNSEDKNIDYKKRYADSTREFQKLREEMNEIKKQARVQEAYGDVMGNNQLFVSLAQNEPDIAKEVAKKFGMTTQEALSKIQGTPVEDENPSQDIESIVEKRLKAHEVQKVVQDYKSKLSDDIVGEVMQEYEAITAGKDIDPSLAKKYLDMIVSYRNKPSQTELLDKQIADSASLGVSQAASAPKEKKEVKGASDLAAALGLGDLYK